MADGGALGRLAVDEALQLEEDVLLARKNQRTFQTEQEEPEMDSDKLNMEVRKFLKTVGVSSQREIETALAAAVKAGVIKGDAKLRAKMTLQIDAVNLTHVVEDIIDLG
jgi:Family of unknown function (DUF6494)